MREKINIVWFKRDLRLSDHAPLKEAELDENPTLLLYVFEPMLIGCGQYNDRHWRFVYESIKDMNSNLQEHNLKIHVAYGDIFEVFEELNTCYEIECVFSHEETGVDLTFQRDIKFRKWCDKQNIQWFEYPTNAIHRGLKNRDGWKLKWEGRIKSVPIQNELTHLIEPDREPQFTSRDLPESWLKRDKHFQEGGSQNAKETLESFLNERAQYYGASISKPGDSRSGCSRLSAYLAWGNISLREAHHYWRKVYKDSPFKKDLRSFESRLNWHCHFIQKFESEPEIENQNFNKGYDDIRTEINENFIEAWKTGNTGYPLVDACMRAVTKTGYLNFRMRAMLVSFLTHHLWQDWRTGAQHLGKQFLDFEPGIHYPQFQMQAGSIGINTIRIYNPVKQSVEHDPNGIFIKEFVEELKSVPVNFIHEPWRMTDMEQEMYNCVVGRDYPNPIVDIKETYRFASSQLWSKKGDYLVKEENERIKGIHIKTRKSYQL